MLLRLFLRVLSLSAKFGLTIVIARTVGFSAVAEYGIAVAVSVVASKVLGLGFSAELNRRMSRPQPEAAIATARALRSIYAGSYVIAAIPCLAAVWAGNEWAGQSFGLWSWAMILLVAASEHHAFEVNTYIFSLHRARAGSVMLFLRTGGWAAVAIVGLVCDMPGGISSVFMLWTLTNVFVIFWAWSLIERTATVRPSETDQATPAASSLRETWIAGAPYYIGGIVLAGLQYVERFVASAFLPANDVGRYVFAWSIANAVQTICYATVGVVAAPRLARVVEAATADWHTSFRILLARTIAISMAVALAIMLASPIIFRMAKEAVTTTGFVTLAVLVVSFVMRSLGDLLWAAAVARKARGRIVIGMLAAVAWACPASLWLIPGHGTVSIALTHLLASVLVLIALAWAQSREPAQAS
ncbi:polysaccharide biosynthesis protein [Caballeronia sp. ATUFL_M2_KS44]|uniref:lipopolysaccharide biosynthesis protein n=1 Tax=Caballeronia sp. ATUFL_M2_KS44 TaxID=2921767 RepID=UPI00202937B6|nr:polysaccharide biosynthesis protein [Caballeronia sp. ATUFL_M2_KS44]